MWNTTIQKIETCYSMKSPTECYKLRILGIICIILFLSSLAFNTLLLKTFYKNKNLRTSFNAIIIALTILNLIGTILELPFIIISNLSCRWIFDKWGCITSSVIMFWIGCTSIYLMTAISFQRFYILYKPFNIRNISYKISLIIVFVCILYGLMWSLFPVFGWSYYTLEGSLTSCGIEWRKQSFNLNSFKIAIFVFVYLIPLIVIIFTSIKLVLIVKDLSKVLIDSNIKNKRVRKEKRLTIVSIFITIAFILAWSPYSVVNTYLSLIDSNANISPLIITTLSILGKSSVLWTSLLYVVFTNGIYKKVLKRSTIRRNSSKRKQQSKKQYKKR